ncbi:MAG: ATP-binding protein [Bradymonadaceae bacterium]
MLFSFRSKLFLISVVLILGFIAISGAYLDITLRGWLERRVEGDLLRQAGLVHQSLVMADPDWTMEAVHPLVDLLGQAGETRITVIDEDGAVLGDSDLSYEKVARAENHAHRPEIEMALTHSSGRAVRRSDTLDRDMVFVAIPFDREGRRGTVRVAVSVDEVGEAIARLRLVILIASIFGLGAAVFMSGVASDLMSRTLRELIVHARQASHRTERTPAVSTVPDSTSVAGSIGRLTGELERVVATLANERDRFEAVLEGMNEAVIAVDHDHRITLVNHAAQKLLGLGEGSVGKRFDAIDEGPTLVDLLPDVGADALRTTEFELSGSPPRQVLARSAPQRTGAGAVIVLHDVTELRRLETIRRDFVANVSHELRTPVSVIQANAETLLDGALDDSLNARDFVDAIHRNAERLSRLIGDLLDISRLEADKYEFDLEPIALYDVAHRAAQTVLSKRERPNTKLDIAVNSDHIISADAKALDQILLNLIDNAVKYAPDQSLVHISSVMVDQHVLIEVRDNGPGIDTAHHDRIFERFYRVDKGRSSHMGGTGLGLSIVKHLVTSMGGTVGYRQNEPTGSVFFFTLPTGV